jgi:zinc transport system substrate-binding protein
MRNLHTRRDVLGIGTSALAASLAGCLGTGDNENTTDSTSTNSSGASDAQSPTATSSFAVLGDFASEVAGDAATVNTLVPVGQHGHGWSPSPQIQRSALNADLFIYMAEGFQPWADDIVTNINNGGTSVTVVEAREGIDLLDIGSSHDHSTDEHESEGGHDYKKAHEHEHGTKSEYGHEKGNGHGATDHDTHAAPNETAGHGHDEHEKKGEHGHEDEREHDHDHGGVDPHFWLDPHRSKQAVENIREGFITVDSSNAETYANNANAYIRRLDELDTTFASALGDMPKDRVLVAGHNAFQYLGSKYGFEIEALTGLSPDDQPTPKDIAQAQEIITDHDIDYILAPVLESDRAATTLAHQTDAKGILPITAIAGMTQKWQDKNWGYIDLMKHINLQSLKQALGAT